MDEEQRPKKKIVAIPTIDYYEKMYGRSLEGNDQKAIGIFKTYESQEKHRRLQHELQLIKEGSVSERVLDAIVKPKRKSKHQGYESWATKMLIWFAEKKI
jgi:hypothetical protein